MFDIMVDVLTNYQQYVFGSGYITWTVFMMALLGFMIYDQFSIETIFGMTFIGMAATSYWLVPTWVFTTFMVVTGIIIAIALARITGR